MNSSAIRRSEVTKLRPRLSRAVMKTWSGQSRISAARPQPPMLMWLTVRPLWTVRARFRCHRCLRLSRVPKSSKRFGMPVRTTPCFRLLPLPTRGSGWLSRRPGRQFRAGSADGTLATRLSATARFITRSTALPLKSRRLLAGLARSSCRSLMSVARLLRPCLGQLLVSRLSIQVRTSAPVCTT